MFVCHRNVQVHHERRTLYPPCGVRFRLQGKRSGCVLVGNTNNTLTDYDGGEVYDDQWFTLAEVPGSSDTYFIRSTYNRNNNKVIFCRAGAYEVGLYRTDYEDQHFRLDPGEGEFRGLFRLLAPATNRVITSNGRSNGVGNYPADKEKYDDQYFSFLFEDLVFDYVEYDIDLGATIGEGVPETVSETISFEHTSGITLTEGMTASFGIPGVMDGEITTEMSIVDSFTFGQSKTIEHTVGSSVTVSAPPRTTTTVEATVTQSKITVPAKIYSKSKALGITVITEVIYKGAPVWGIVYDIKPPVPLDDNAKAA
ncbi:hypothetical protein BO94DRAFT_545053 [Aspergillus sclerotioniger CBS 115572]|uniref:Agglutinin domain-containing protein n=1 Tax=Aspergillus sclerotioniger CBS 115572 TaxID=1450535 RepID=A0A317WV45_9EURO|nr:hypothetical protein BO94DRAFT_545053 [Aspergillus sclerotioniger CBS 115572]PWY90294.1 hypothetical protein BO94DRAFT_545053 [Aspergillus sclerotioniger CBS 115572]